ncbi:MAG: Ig domain-containing protein [Clostridiales bacterium]|nr:Ig domain-containing protein [Clostridiales bacterium]
MSETEISVSKGKSTSVSASVEGASAKDKVTFVWSTENKSIATVKAGKIRGVAAGNTNIICIATLSDNTVLSATCNVTVYNPVNSIKGPGSQITLHVNEKTTPEIKVLPNDATNKSYHFESSDESIVSVNGSILHGVAPGKAKITAFSDDGSNKKTTFNVFVPTLKADFSEIHVTELDERPMKAIKYYGKDPYKDLTISLSNLSIADFGMYDSYDHNYVYTKYNNQLEFELAIFKAGTAKVTINDKSSPGSKLTFNVIVEHSAVYDTVSFPKIQYKDVMRYPDEYEGQNVSFTGHVLQVMFGDTYTEYRISSRGRYDDVVYVRMLNDTYNQTILEDDNVVVYGKYKGRHTYTSTMGAQVTVLFIEGIYAELRY